MVLLRKCVSCNLLCIYMCTATHALLMVTEDPYNVSRPLDQMLGPIAINSSVLSNEFILVQKPVNWSLGEEYSSPLWVSNFRRPFQQANFPLQIQEEVGLWARPQP